MGLSPSSPEHHQYDEDDVQEDDVDDELIAHCCYIPVCYLVKEDCVNASMKHGRLIWIVHGERPDEALVHQVDALREAVVVRVDEEGALLCVTERPRAGSGCCCQRLLGTRTSDCIRGSSTKSW